MGWWGAPIRDQVMMQNSMTGLELFEAMKPTNKRSCPKDAICWLVPLTDAHYRWEGVGHLKLSKQLHLSIPPPPNVQLINPESATSAGYWTEHPVRDNKNRNAAGYYVKTNTQIYSTQPLTEKITDTTEMPKIEDTAGHCLQNKYVQMFNSTRS